MKFEKPAPWLVTLFDAVLAEAGGDRRLMFGCPAGFLRGQMFCGLFNQQLFVRLAEPERAQLLAMDGAHAFDPMGGRPMREYTVLPESLLEDEEAVLDWVRKANAYAQTLPAKTLARARKQAPARKTPKRR